MTKIIDEIKTREAFEAKRIIEAAERKISIEKQENIKRHEIVMYFYEQLVNSSVKDDFRKFIKESENPRPYKWEVRCVGKGDNNFLAQIDFSGYYEVPCEFDLAVCKLFKDDPDFHGLELDEHTIKFTRGPGSLYPINWEMDIHYFA